MGDKTRWRVFVAYLLCMALKVEKASTSQELIKNLTAGFGKAFDQCKTELNLPDHIIQDFYNFWKEDYKLLNRETGCAIMCMASKFDLITDDMKLHHGKAHEFAKTHGADDDTAQKLVTMLHECEKDFDSIADDCEKTLEIAKCFRTKIHGVKWAPSMETILEEVMAEM